MSAPRYKRGGKWVRTSGDDIPPRAMEAGHDNEGRPLYVGRARHEGGLFPGKVNPRHNCCYIPWGGEEHSKEEYDILVAPRNCDLTWVDASNGHIPTGAVQGGFNENNDPLYIGRAHIEDSFAVGKVNPEHGCCYVAYGGAEHAKEHYQVLVIDRMRLKH
ncbi:uncharacterized protein LOC111711763 isoform X2 [Eurytemora carolleeae]|uniref:uncharacterized protein LOC111711763 isoform X2 n=1 Tax=Eurytemora carolleeae TaxID=1294199 RepID=UPI000C76C1F7|nr:uncharacterized protein LOC111711763 isoform X2 [Eurytemora carolleeae]|eukprot:XP_023341960.1 uncharacterized protein LOC111711763 isoform X2 [Eurytemora affinis]